MAIEGMSCAACALRIEKGLSKLSGVKKAYVNLATEQAKVFYHPSQLDSTEIVHCVEAPGYQAISHAPLAKMSEIPLASPDSVSLAVSDEETREQRRKATR